MSDVSDRGRRSCRVGELPWFRRRLDGATEIGLTRRTIDFGRDGGALRTRGSSRAGSDDGFDDFEDAGGRVDDDFEDDFDEGPGDRPVVEEPDTSGACGSAVESEQFRLMNQDRVSEGLSALRCDLRLAEVARAHSRDMFERDFFDHTNPDGEQPWDRMRRYGITGWSLAGENIASGQRSPAEVQAAWMNSPGHRANILTADFTHVGVAFFTADGRTYWTQLFARF